MQAHELLFEALLIGQSKPLPFDQVAPDVSLSLWLQ
jgi:hypothetical protein